jgi:hypothetical protein
MIVGSRVPSVSYHFIRARGAGRAALLFALVMSLLSSCSDPTTPPTATPGGETLTGTVAAFNTTSPTTLSPKGIQVVLQGTSFQGIADTAGHFTIPNIPAGVYNIIFSKPGYDSMIYPVHHFIGVGTDIINDAYLIQESTDSLSIAGVSYVFTVSVSKIVHVIDTIFRDSSGVIDTVVLAHDSLSITYDTVQNANALIVKATLIGNMPPSDVFVYSSLDSDLFPWSPSPQSPANTEDVWLATHVNDPTYHPAFQSPRITGGSFTDTLARDVATLHPYSLPAGQVVYVYMVGHSNTAGLPAMNGEYQHFSTTPYGPKTMRFRLVVP